METPDERADRLIADPDGIYQQLIDERFGPLDEVRRERLRQPRPLGWRIVAKRCQVRRAA